MVHSCSQRLVRFALALLFACGLAGLQTAEAQFNGPALPSTTTINRNTQVTTDPAILFPPAHDVRLAAGDLITVRVFGPGDYSPIVRIAIDGTVQLPLIGVVRLGGLTIFEAETLVATRLKEARMYRDPQVTIQVTEGPNSSVTVVGEAHGLVPVVGQRRLLDVLSAAGGLPPTASHIITINRPGSPEPIVVDLGTDPARSELANVPIFPGDTIVVARVGVVYVLGAFKTGGTVPITGNTPLTLLQVAALTGGPNYEGDYKDLRLIRTNGTQRTLVKINIHNVLYGKAPDPVLQADDIVFLPTNTFKNLIKQGGAGTLLGLASILITLTR